MMLGVGFYVAMLFNAPWMTFAATLLAYLVGIPFGIRSYRRMEARTATGADVIDDDEDDGDDGDDENGDGDIGGKATA